MGVALEAAWAPAARAVRTTSATRAGRLFTETLRRSRFRRSLCTRCAGGRDFPVPLTNPRGCAQPDRWLPDFAHLARARECPDCARPRQAAIPRQEAAGWP